MSGIFPVSKEDVLHASNNTKSEVSDKWDFVKIFPAELSNKLFAYVSEKDLFTCSKCSISWRHVINNDSQWKMRCIRRNWASVISTNEAAQKWNQKKSHVSKSDTYKFRTSPLFCLPEIASLRISPLCDWAVFFRQSFHIQRNWNNGIYVVHRLLDFECSTDYEFLILNNNFDCDGNILVCGTSSGKSLIWNIEGVPRFLTCISPSRRVEVESVLLRSNYLIILYQTGLIKVYDIRKLTSSSNSQAEISLSYQIKANGTQSVENFEFILNAEYVNDQDDSLIEEDDGDDVEGWIRGLFRLDLWGTEQNLGSDMMIYANAQVGILTGILCKCFFVWDIHQGNPIRKIQLPLGYQIIYQSYLSNRKLYFSTKKREDQGNEHTSYFILVYDISSLEGNESTKTPISILAESMVEEIRSDSKDERVVFSTQDGILSGVSLDLETNVIVESLFTIYDSSFVDNLTVSDSLIVYHKYDGFLVGINWAGERLYEIEAHMGLVKGLQISQDRFVSGGDAMQLFVWDANTGVKLHTVHHQPCRIQHLYADETKIVTVGREDLPVVIAYW